MKKTVSLLIAAIMLIGGLAPLMLTASAAGTFSVALNTAWPVALDYDTAEFPDLTAIPDGKIFVFKLKADEKYDLTGLVLYDNGEIVRYDAASETYAVAVNRDINLICPDAEAGGSLPLKQFRVRLPQGAGFYAYAADVPGANPVWGVGDRQDYLVEWGGTYTFRIVFKAGYEGSYNYDVPGDSRMIILVSTASGKVLLPGGANFDVIKERIVYDDVYLGIDEVLGPQYKKVVKEVYYTITDVKEDMEISVENVTADKKESSFSMIMQLLRAFFNYIMTKLGFK